MLVTEWWRTFWCQVVSPHYRHMSACITPCTHWIYHLKLAHSTFVSFCILLAFFFFFFFVWCSCSNAHVITSINLPSVYAFLCAQHKLMNNSKHHVPTFSENGDTKPPPSRSHHVPVRFTHNATHVSSTNICAEYISFLCVSRWTESNENEIKNGEKRTKRSRHSNEPTAQKTKAAKKNCT